jgi:valyl-tRNA synthetase
MNLGPDFKPKKIDVKKLSKIDRWCLTRFYETAEEVNRFLEEYRLNEAANSLYQFSWHEFCDWYLELIKPALRDPKLKAETGQVLVFIFRELMKLLHPFIPFVTEEIWQALPPESQKDKESVMAAHYPQFERRYVDRKSADEVRAIQEVVSYIRNVRGEHQIPPQKKFPVTVVAKNRKIFDLLSDKKTAVEKLGGISELILSSKALPQMSGEKIVTCQILECEIFIRMTELFDLEEEKKRLQKELTRAKGDLEGLQKKLSNPSFVKNAPTDVVQGEKQRSEELERRVQKIKEGLKRIEG